MAVIITSGSTTLNTANGFYRVEAHNLCPYGSFLSLASDAILPVTFANAGNCQGIVLGMGAVSPLADKDVTVKLQEFVAGVWTDRASVTQTAAQILNNSTNPTGCWFTPFEGGTFPYAVTTAVSTWRFYISNATGTNDWRLVTSNGTAPFYATWCDNLVTFADNDSVVVKNTCIIDRTSTFRGVLGTGEATQSICGIICKGTSNDPATVSLLQWENPAAASYTLTLNGKLVSGVDSGVRVGTSASPIAYANRANIVVTAATFGTATNTGFASHALTLTNNTRANYFFYGERPTYESTTLASQANSGQPVLITNDATGWVAGDTVFIGRSMVGGVGDTTFYTILSVVGTTITLTGNIATYNREAGATVARTNGYGVSITSTTAYTQVVGAVNNFIMDGVDVRGLVFQYANGNANLGNSANLLPITWTHFTFRPAVAALQTTTFYNYPQGLTISYGQLCFSNFTFTLLTGAVGFTTVQALNCFCGTLATTIRAKIAWTDCIRDNYSTSFAPGFIQATFRRNKFYRPSNTALTISSFTEVTDWGENEYDGCSLGAYLAGTGTNGCYAENERFGQIVANGTDIFIQPNAFTKLHLQSPVGNVSIDLTNQATWYGSQISISNNNTVDNDDRVTKTYGFFQRTGFGLSDTLVWNGTAFAAAAAGQFAIRMQSNTANDLLIYEDNAGSTTIGNCQGLPVTVNARVKINNAAYYAGTHTKPTLRVTYDGGTQITKVADGTTADQQLQVSFTPTTTSQFITIQLEMATDATGSNAYVYLGELVVAQPAGVLIDTTRIGSWKLGLPLGTFRTFPAPSSVWDEQRSAHPTSGTFGEGAQLPVVALA